MKNALAFLICISAGIGIGWYFGYVCPAARNQRQLLEEYLPFKQEMETNMAYLNRQREESSKLAKPWEASTASIALVGLKDLDTTNLGDARFRLATLIAIYYHAHLNDGDTNILNRIASCAATNSALSNAIYGSWP
jgi:hypothetical protein